MKPKQVLVLTPQFPYPPHQGTTIRNYNLIAGLAPRHGLHLLSFGNPERAQRAPLESLCRSVQVVRPPLRTTAGRLKGLFFSPLPDMAQRLPSAEFSSALTSTLAREDPDIVQVEGIELAQYLFQVAAARGTAARPLILFDDHNAEYVLQRRAFETDLRRPRRWAGAAYSFVQWRRLRAYEGRACRAADRVVACSAVDAEALRRLSPGLEPRVVPNGVDVEFYTAPAAVPAGGTAPIPAGNDLVFTGKMDFRPNVDAVLWFVEQVLPRIRLACPQARLWVVGKDPHPRLAHLAADPAVVLTGWVEDIRPYIASAGVYVIPLRIGGGTRLKVLEAMAMGKAIVSTALGCEGFDLAADREMVIADRPEEFAAAVLALLRDPDRRRQLGDQARRFVSAQYDWRNIVPRLERAYQGR